MFTLSVVRGKAKKRVDAAACRGSDSIISRLFFSVARCFVPSGGPRWCVELVLTRSGEWGDTLLRFQVVSHTLVR